jgi:hypothetical protein
MLPSHFPTYLLIVISYVLTTRLEVPFPGVLFLLGSTEDSVGRFQWPSYRIRSLFLRETYYLLSVPDFKRSTVVHKLFLKTRAETEVGLNWSKS